jgi:IS5 family transposase
MPHKKRHKDIDARWTKKNNEKFYGYKNHAKVDSKSKFINTFVVTSASVHDSQAIEDLLTEKDKDQELYADSAYTGENQEEIIAKYEMKNKVHEKGYKNKPLTEEQKANNREKSKTRARVEHVLNSLNIGCTSTKSKQVWFCIRFAQYFGFMEQSMNGLKLKSVGIIRATGIIGLINLTYNLFRYEQVVRLNLLTIK